MPRSRRSLLMLAGALALGVAAPFASAEQPASETQAPAATPAKAPVVKQWQVLSGAMLGTTPTFVPPASPRPAAPMHVQFLSPVATASRNGIVTIVDMGHRRILRYEPARMAMTQFTDHVVSAFSAIALGSDMSLYLTDLASGRVLHFSWDGRPMPPLGHDAVLRRPVGVVVDEPSAQVLVADSLYNHVVVFSSLGHVLTTLRSEESRSIESMARGPDGLYLVDRLSRQVVVMGLDGVDRYAFGSETLKAPHAIVVDRFNRVFVSDDFDNTIKVFEGGELVASVGGSGATPGRFNRITHLSIDRNTLYVADSLNARIQFSQLSQPPARRPVPE